MTENSMTTMENNIAVRQAEAMQGELIDRQDSMDLFGAFGDTGLRESHPFVGTPADVWRQVMLASNDDVIDGKKALNTTLRLQAYYCHEVDMRDRVTNVLNRGIRTVLYDASGDRFAFVSLYIARDLLRMTKIFGKGPWKEPILVKPVAIAVAGNQNVYRLMPG